VNIYANVDHLRASFRTCASSTYPALGGTPFLFSLHLSGAKDLLLCRCGRQQVLRFAEDDNYD
jgi:hypothetical protein